MNILEYENYHEEKTLGEIEFPFNIYPCSIPLDFKNVPLHWHDEMELIYIKKGEGTVTVDFKSQHVGERTIILILPGQLHSIDQYKDAKMEYENIIFDPTMLIPKSSSYAKEDFLYQLKHGRITVPTFYTPVYPYYPDLIVPIDACDSINETKPQGYQLYIKSKLYELFFILDNRCRNLVTKKTNAKSLEKMKLVLKYVENNYANKITIEEIADIAGFSQSHFMRYFKETMDVSFIEYLKDYRLTMAARLLQGSEDSVLDIATSVGFDNLSYFNRAFKEKYKTTPLKYRKEQ